MAQRTLGLDIGSHSVKAVLLQAGLRRFEAVDYAEAPFPPPPPSLVPEDEDEGDVPEEDPDDSWFERLEEALADLKERLESPFELCHAAVPASRVTLRPLSLPFTRARELEMVLGQEVEEYIPFRDAEQVVFDYQVLSQEDGVSELLVAVCERAFLARLLATLQVTGFDPRSVSAGGLGKAALVDLLLPGHTRPVAVVDLGHESTTITVVADGRPALWRSLARGASAVIREMADAYEIDIPSATVGLAQDAEVLPPHSIAEHHPDRLRVSDLIKKACAPVLRGLKQTFWSYAGIHEEEISEVFVCGGLSRLPGLTGHLSARLGVPVHPFELGSRDWLRLSRSPDEEARLPEALSIGLASLPLARSGHLDFRRGAFSFQGGYQFARGKLLSIAVALCMLILGFGFYTYAKAEDLAAQERALIAEIKARTEALLGEPMSNAEAAIAKMRKTERSGKFEEMPKQSAYDLFSEISRVLPVDVQVDFEKFSIDLDRHRAEIRGKTTSATAVEQIVEALEGIECFGGGIEKEKNEKVGSDGKQLFVLSIKMSC